MKNTFNDAGGDTLVKRLISNDDGIIDVYQNNSVLTRITETEHRFLKTIKEF